MPVAIRVGLHPLAAAMAVSLAGQGMALGGDIVIQAAPKLSVSSMDVAVGTIVFRAGVLSFIAGAVSLLITFFIMRRMDGDRVFDKSTIKDPFARDALGEYERRTSNQKPLPTNKYAKSAPGMAILVPLVLTTIVVVMFTNDVSGDAATALLGGAATLLIVIGSFWSRGWEALDDVVQYFIDGFVFAFKAMGPVIPIAGFFPTRWLYRRRCILFDFFYLHFLML